jgi:ankyrin repeat protein
MLLDAGADPNVYFTDGQNHFTPLTGVFGEGEQSPTAVPPHPQAEALARLLLERGANSYDPQVLYNTALWHDDDRWLELLWTQAVKTSPTVGWKIAGKSAFDFLLDLAVSRNHLKRAEWLLQHGANPNAIGHYSKQSFYKHAVLLGLTEMAALMLRFGAEPIRFEGYEAFHVACMRLDRQAAQALLEQHPEYLAAPGPMIAAAHHDLRDVAAFLLELGMSPDVDDHGYRPLHTAAASDSPNVAALLIERGAEIDAREPKYGGTPLGWARHQERRRMIELLSPVSRDVFALAATGNVERLRQVLTAEPEFARAMYRSLTPLFYLPEDDDQAVEVAELLLTHGTDPTIKNNEGATAADCARKRGLDDAGELIDSAGG